MIGGDRTSVEARSRPGHLMRVIEAEQSHSIGSVQCERIPHTVGPLDRGWHLPDFEFHEIALSISMPAAIEGQKEFESVFRGALPLNISYQHINDKSIGSAAGVSPK